MNSPLLILLPDESQIDDLLFQQALARTLEKEVRVPPALLIHGSGADAERLLEADGLIVSRTHGLLDTTSPREAVFVEQAIRAANRKLVRVLTDAAVHAVGLQGTDRGLFTLGASGIVASGADWIAGLARKGAVPVLSSLARREDGSTAEIRPADAAAALAAGMQEPEIVAVLFAPPAAFRNISETAGKKLEIEEAERLGLLPNPEIAVRLATQGIGGLVASVTSFLQGGEVCGLRLIT